MNSDSAMLGQRPLLEKMELVRPVLEQKLENFPESKTWGYTSDTLEEAARIYDRGNDFEIASYTPGTEGKPSEVVSLGGVGGNGQPGDEGSYTDPGYPGTSPVVKIVELGKRDFAQLSEKGGIDLNQINLNAAGKAVNVQFDPAQLNELMRDGFEGFVPVIINITPIANPLPLLGVGSRKEPTDVLMKV